MKSSGHSSWVLGAATLFNVLAVTLTMKPCSAQVLGEFSPGVYAQPAYGPLPMRRELMQVTPNTNTPLLQAVQLQDEIRQSRRPYIGTVFASADQFLTNRDFRLHTITQGVEAGFFPNDQTQVVLDYLPTLFGLKNPTVAGEEWRATILRQPTNRLQYRASLGLFHTFDHVKPSLSVIGNGGFNYLVNDRFSINAGFSRYIVGNSLLSATGLNLPSTHTLVGRVKANQGQIGFRWRPTPKTVVEGQYFGGFFQGYREELNPYQGGNFRIGRALISRERGSHLEYLQPQYQLMLWSFAHDLSGTGNLTLTPSADPSAILARYQSSQMGLTNVLGSAPPGVGGYFSPKMYMLNQVRMDAGGRLYKNTYYNIGCGLGTQNIKSTSQHLGDTGLVGIGNASVVTRLTKNITAEQGGYILVAGTQYARWVVYQQTRYYF